MRIFHHICKRLPGGPQRDASPGPVPTSVRRVGRSAGRAVLLLLTLIVLLTVVAVSSSFSHALAPAVGLVGALGLLYCSYYVVEILRLLPSIPKSKASPKDKRCAYVAVGFIFLTPGLAIILVSALGYDAYAETHPCSERSSECIPSDWSGSLGLAFDVAMGTRPAEGESLADSAEVRSLLSTQSLLWSIYTVGVVGLALGALATGVVSPPRLEESEENVPPPPEKRQQVVSTTWTWSSSGLKRTTRSYEEILKGD